MDISGYDEFSEATFHGGPDEINGVKTPLELDDILSPGSRQILVEGPPGIGKSTLCWELCRQWDTLKSMQDFKIVLQLKLREKYIQTAASLSELFYHEDKRLRDSVVDEVYECEGEGVLMILDGFDETPSFLRRNKNSLIMKIIRGRCLPRATCLVTSRPSACTHAYFPRDNRHIEILGFTDENKVKFAEIAFKLQPEVLAHFKNFIFSNPIINSLMYIPVNCAIIAQVYKDIRKSRNLMPKTMTQLYTTLVLVLIRRYMIETGEWDEECGVPSNLNDLPPDISTDLKRVSELAYSALFNDSEDIQLVFTSSDVGEGFQHLGLLSETKEMYVCEGARTSYSFLHLSIQEFLAAWHVTCHPDLVGSALSKVSSFRRNRHSVFGLFSAGMIGCEQIPIKSLEMYSLKLFYEAQNSCSNFHSKIGVLRYRSNSLNLTNPLDMYIFGYTLVHARFKWELTVSISFDMLVRSLADHAGSSDQILGSIEKLNLYIKANCASSQLEDLPKCVQNSVVKVVCGVGNSNIPTIVKGITTLHNIRTLYLDFKEACQDDHLLYRSLHDFLNLKEFRLHFYHMTAKGMHEISASIANNHSLEQITMNFYQYRYHASVHGSRIIDAQVLNCSPIIEAACVCSTAESLTFNNIPFQALDSEIASHVTSLKFTLQPDPVTSTLRFFNTLCYIADMCRLPSLKSLEVVTHHLIRVRDEHGGLPAVPVSPQIFFNFAAVLNNSLRCNSSIEKIDLAVTVSCPLDHITLSRALQRHPDVLRQSLKRSKSLCDLTEMRTVRIWGYGLYRRNRRRRHSCPDLLEMQPLHNMHPLLYRFLLDNGFRGFYYKSQVNSKPPQDQESHTTLSFKRVKPRIPNKRTRALK